MFWSVVDKKLENLTKGITPRTHLRDLFVIGPPPQFIERPMIRVESSAPNAALLREVPGPFQDHPEGARQDSKENLIIFAMPRR
jgi:hypothetical protein